jgi:alpha-1,2-mannosyltransferase
LASLALGALLGFLLMWNVNYLRFMRNEMHMNDFGKVYCSARAFLAGEGMYGPDPGQPIPMGIEAQTHLWNLNPPHFHLLVVPFALLSEDHALVFWFLLNFLGLAAACVLVRSELRLTLTKREVFFTLLAFLAFSGMAMVLVTGQHSFLLLFLLTLAWRSARHGRWTLAGAILGTLIALKLFLALFLPYLLLTGRWRALAAAFGTLAFLFVLGYLIFGGEAYRAWVGLLHGIDWEWRAMNASAAGILARTFGRSPNFLPLVEAPGIARGVFPVLAAAFSFVTLGAILRDNAPGSTDRHFLLLTLCSLLASPLGWTYYLWMALGPLVAFILFLRSATGVSRRRARWAFLLVVIGCLGLMVPHTFVELCQPNRFFTVTLGSTYFWSLLALWLAVIVSVLAGVEWKAGGDRTQQQFPIQATGCSSGCIPLP